MMYREFAPCATFMESVRIIVDKLCVLTWFINSEAIGELFTQLHPRWPSGTVTSISAPVITDSYEQLGLFLRFRCQRRNFFIAASDESAALLTCTSTVIRTV